jgi:hypothetical protein
MTSPNGAGNRSYVGDAIELLTDALVLMEWYYRPALGKGWMGDVRES